jgi:hypothetical protein
MEGRYQLVQVNEDDSEHILGQDDDHYKLRDQRMDIMIGYNYNIPPGVKSLNIVDLEAN